MIYDTDLQIIRGTNGTFTNNYLNEFINLTGTLTKNQRGTGNQANNIVFENILDLDKIRNDASSDGKVIEKEVTIGSETYYVCIIDNEFSGAYDFNLSNKQGIIVTTGDINVQQNFTGLIISNAAIELYASDITANSDLVNLILTRDSDISKYFRANSISSEISTINVAALIEYENWSKN